MRSGANLCLPPGGSEAALFFASLREGGGIFAENDGRSMRAASLSSSVISVIEL